MKTICPTTYHHNDFVGTRAVDVWLNIASTNEPVMFNILIKKTVNVK